MAYSKPYFEKLVYVDDKLKINLEAKEEETNNSNLSSDNLSEQKRIMYLSVKAYKDR
ncbi:MAG: hypothetical protein LBQ24_06030 [Candidatus Peribacteria bacterium]|nr:hypothetical protein [Candidatus Peribacteria bacterium]